MMNVDSPNLDVQRGVGDADGRELYAHRGLRVWQSLG